MTCPEGKICALTMVRNDDFFLRKWVAYYGSRLGKENLFVFFDGEDQIIPDFCRSIHAEVRSRAEGNVAQGDRKRARFLSEKARELLASGYAMAIGTDVDEFLIPDPDSGMDLREFLLNLPEHPCHSALGIDVAQHPDLEASIDTDSPMLSQRRFGLLHSRYTKASVMRKPAVWGSGFHRMKGHDLHIAPDLYLFHFGCVDIERLRNKIQDKDLINNGWSRHFKKRIRSNLEVAAGKPHGWTPLTAIMRRIQQTFRPIFALNKPTSFGWRPVVEIPERFRNIV